MKTLRQLAGNKLLLSTLALIAANLVPLIGVAAGDWSISVLLYAYFIETLVIGMLTIGKIRRVVEYSAQVKNNPTAVFVLVYVSVMAICGAQIVAFNEASLSMLYIAILPVIALIISHGVSFYVNFLGQKEYEHVTATSLALQPFARVIILYMMLAISLAWAHAGVLVLVKTLFDVFFHLRIHTPRWQAGKRKDAEGWL